MTSPTQRRIIFLDFDGVLNSSVRYSSLPGIRMLEGGRIDPLAVEQLNVLATSMSNIAIVISSTWRLFYPLEDLALSLYRLGLSRAVPVIGTTPEESINSTRGEDIAAWLRLNADSVASCVILDDDEDMDPVSRYQVLIPGKYGLMSHHIPLAKEKLLMPFNPIDCA